MAHRHRSTRKKPTSGAVSRWYSNYARGDPPCVFRRLCCNHGGPTWWFFNMDVFPPGFPRRPQGSAKEADPTAICRSDTAQCGSMFLGFFWKKNMVVWGTVVFLCRCVFQIAMTSCSHLRGVVVVVLVVAAVLVAAVVLVVVVVLVVAAVVVAAAAALAFVATVVAVAI